MLDSQSHLQYPAAQQKSDYPPFETVETMALATDRGLGSSAVSAVDRLFENAAAVAVVVAADLADDD